MKRYLAALLFILAAQTATAVDEWDTVDFALLTTASAALVTDWSQTRWIARNGQENNIYETNPILGDRPSTGEVDRYFAASLAGTAVIAHILPSAYRKTWLGIVTAVEIGYVSHNYQIGIHTEF